MKEVVLPYQLLDQLYSEPDDEEQTESVVIKRERKSKNSILANCLVECEFYLLSEKSKLYYKLICEGQRPKDLYSIGLTSWHQRKARLEILSLKNR